MRYRSVMEATQHTHDAPSGAWLDRLGSSGSFLCAVHCAIGALAPGLFAAVGLGSLLSEPIEWALSITAVVFALTSAAFTFRAHRSTRIGVSFIAFAALLLVARFSEHWGIPGGPLLAVVGGVGLAITHVFSIRAVRAAEACCDH